MKYSKFIFVSAFFLFSNSLCANVSGEPAYEAKNSDNEKIIVMKDSIDATTSNVFSVYLMSNLPNAKPVKVLKVDDTEGVSVSWIDNDHIKIEMACGRIFEFRNFADFIYRDFKRVKISMDSIGLCSK